MTLCSAEGSPHTLRGDAPENVVKINNNDC